MTKYTVAYDSAIARKYEVEAETPDQAVKLVKDGKAKLVDSISSEAHNVREPRVLGADAMIGAGVGRTFRTSAQNENVAAALA